MSLTLNSRRVGDVTIINCAGRIVLGEEAQALQTSLEAALSSNAHVLLHLGGVESIDSSGLGLLARYLTRVKNGGTLRLCALSPKVEDVLRITRLKASFRIYETESDSIADLHQGMDPGRSADAFRVLCVDESPDVLAFLRELLRSAGYHALTAVHLPDALILLKAARPKVVVAGRGIALATTPAAQQFNRIASSGAIVELPDGFSHQDAGDAAQHVLAAIRALAEPTG